MIAVLNKARRGTDRLLDYFLIFVWLLVIPVYMLWPASYWYELRKVYVTDTYTELGERIIEVDRSINEDFRGEWRVEEQLRVGEGWVTFQVCEGSAEYRQDKTPPEPTTLSWWKGNNCQFEAPFTELKAGEYRLLTQVEIFPRFAPSHKVETISNTFTR